MFFTFFVRDEHIAVGNDFRVFLSLIASRCFLSKKEANLKLLDFSYELKGAFLALEFYSL